ncbi:MAG: LysM peptidoglycan-binding domain-containing protein [Anaerolineae bacterium]
MRKSSLWRTVSVILLVFILVQSLALTASAAPPKADGCFYYTVRWGDTLFSIARRYGTSVARITADNGIANPNYIRAGRVLWICPGGWPPPPWPPYPRWHIVRWGETLWGIARMYGVSAWAIASANGIYNMNLIYAGQRLYIP